MYPTLAQRHPVQRHAHAGRHPPRAQIATHRRRARTHLRTTCGTRGGRAAAASAGGGRAPRGRCIRYGRKRCGAWARRGGARTVVLPTELLNLCGTRCCGCAQLVGERASISLAASKRRAHSRQKRVAERLLVVSSRCCCRCRRRRRRRCCSLCRRCRGCRRRRAPNSRGCRLLAHRTHVYERRRLAAGEKTGGGEGRRDARTLGAGARRPRPRGHGRVRALASSGAAAAACGSARVHAQRFFLSVGGEECLELGCSL